MRWILVDVVVGLLAVALLAVVALRLWRRVKALGAAVGVAGRQLDAVTAQLDTLSERQQPFVAPTPAGHVPRAGQQGRGVGSSRSS